MPLLDIVLVHGIEGGAPWTWRQRDADADKPLLPQHLRREIKSLKEGKIDSHSPTVLCIGSGDKQDFSFFLTYFCLPFNGILLM